MRDYGWQVVQRRYGSDEGTEYGFYVYGIAKEGEFRLLKLGTMMMTEFAPSESVIFELDPEFVRKFGPVQESKTAYDNLC